ncbi:MAG: metalloregulator ArsR/SmtB family transcription factor [Pseudomonadota bacterium]
MEKTDDALVNQLSALAQSTRLAVFKMLARRGGEGMAAGRIAEALDVAPNTLSAHLNILLRAQLIDQRRDGRSMIYSVRREDVATMVETLITDCCAGRQDDPLLVAALEARGVNHQHHGQHS